MLTRVLIALSALLLGSSALVGVGFSGATWTHATTAPATVAASPDWTPPVVTVSPVAPGISGTTMIAATAVDARSGIGSVSLEYAPAGGTTWTTITTGCSAASGASPLVYSCQWDTTAAPDGDYQVRARTTDTATPTAYAATSAVVPTQVANSASVVLSPVPSAVHGTVSLASTFYQAVNPTAKMYLEYFDGSAWQQICFDNVGALACTWDTTARPNGSYQLRARAEAGHFTSTDEQSVLVDNQAPTITSLTAPSGELSGVVTLSAAASDAVSSVGSVSFDYQSASGSWTPCGTDSTAPFTCSLATESLADGTYTFRAVARDAADNLSAPVTVERVVSNGSASVSISSPTTGARVRGSAVAVAASASVSTPGLTVGSVRTEWRPAGGAFATVCIDVLAPYGCTWDTTGITYGSYELRSVMTLSNGATRTSGTVDVTVDNRVLAAADVQATNGNGAPVVGDALVFTYSSLVDLATIRGTAWDGSTSVPIDLEFLDAGRTGNSTGKDAIHFTNSQLGWVTFAQNYVASNSTVTVPASMTATNASGATVVTVVLGAVPTNGSKVLADTTSGAMGWLPSTTVTDIFGTACAAAAATESGTSDADF